MRLPAAARSILDRAVLCYVAARTPTGPHLTPVVYVLDGGRLWLTTSRSSAKARAWRRDPAVAGLAGGPDGWVVFRGRVRMYDALDPLSWPAAALGGPRLARAATRFSVKNARFFAGYAVDARRVPFAWTPPGRVFVSVELTAGHVLDAGAVGAGWGEWKGGATARSRSAFEALPPRQALDLRAPAGIRRALGERGWGALALDEDPLTVLPVRFRRVAREAAVDLVIPDQVQALATSPARGRATLTLDHASAWRAAAMRGLMLRGAVELFVPSKVRRGRAAVLERLRAVGSDVEPDHAVLARLEPDRLVWWEGWSTGTVRRDRGGR